MNNLLGTFAQPWALSAMLVPAAYSLFLFCHAVLLIDHL